MSLGTTSLGTAFEDATLVLLRERNVVFAGWRGPPQVEHIRRWHELGRDVARAHPGAGACIDVIYRGTPRFSDEMRREAERFAGDREIFHLGFAHAILMPGLAGTAVRAFVSTVLLVGRPPSPTKVCGDLTTAITWFAPRLAAHGWTATTLAAACAELTRRIG